MILQVSVTPLKGDVWLYVLHALSLEKISPPTGNLLLKMKGMNFSVYTSMMPLSNNFTGGYIGFSLALMPTFDSSARVC